MSDIDVTISGQASTTVTSSVTDSTSVTIDPNNLDLETLSSINSLKSATGTLNTSVTGNTSSINTLNSTTGTLNTSITGNTSIITSITGITGTLETNISSNTASITGITGDISLISGEKLNAYDPISTGEFVIHDGSMEINSSTNNAIAFTINSGKAKITPSRGRGLHLVSNGNNNAAVSAKIEGPVTLTHDIFKDSGQTSGFADNSNHFHDIIKINQITQNGINNNLNLERLQERYYAITGNNVRLITNAPNTTGTTTGKAAFLNKHRVAREIGLSGAILKDTFDDVLNGVTISVTGLQASSNRKTSNQSFFVSNTTPAGKSEPIDINFNARHYLVPNQNVRMTFAQSFEGPIVAASLFGTVSATGTFSGSTVPTTASVELFGGNYKSTNEVPTGITMTGLNHGFELEALTDGTRVGNLSGFSYENVLSLHPKTSVTPNRSFNELLKITYSGGFQHELEKNETVTLITNGADDLIVHQNAFVLDPDPDNNGSSAVLVYGRLIKQHNLTTVTPQTGNWTLHRGSLDGIHNETIGDQLFTFFADNSGHYKNYQIGPGSQTDADCIAIGKNVYNNEPNTVKIGYNNEMLNITSAGISTTGTANISGNFLTSGNLTSHNNILSLSDVVAMNNVSGRIVSKPSNSIEAHGGINFNNGTLISGNNMNLSGNLSVGGNTSLTGTLDVTGSTTIKGATTINSALTADSFTATGDISNRNLTATGNLIVSGNIGVGTSLPTAKLDVNGGINASGVVQTFNSTPNVAQFEVGRNINEMLEIKVDDRKTRLTTFQDSDSNQDHHFILDRQFQGTGPNDFLISKDNVEQVKINTSGNMFVASGLHVSGNITGAGTVTSTSSISRPIQNDETDSTPVRNVKTMTQSAYNSLGSKDANTLYIIL